MKDVAGAVIQATANGGKVIQDVQTLEYPATQVRRDGRGWILLGSGFWVWFAWVGGGLGGVCVDLVWWVGTKRSRMGWGWGSGGRVGSTVFSSSIHPTDMHESRYLHAQIPDQDAQEINKETKAVVADPDGYKVRCG